MKLSVAERIILFGLLPEKGTFLNLKQIRKVREDASFSDKETKDFEIQTTADGRIVWNPKKAKEVEIEISDSIHKIIKDKLEDLDKNAELEERHFTLYEKFIINKG